MSRTIYLIELTEEGLKRAPEYDVNHGHVVVAKDRVEARMLAEAAHMTEPGVLWRETNTSKLSALGIAHGARRSKVILSSGRDG